jgi:hypothetical protein
MYEDDPGLEQRLSRFEAQLDRFSLALHQWRETQGDPQNVTPANIDERLRAIEATITREAHALRQINEEPLKQLQAQAESLGELFRNLQTLVADLKLLSGQTPGSGTAASWPLERVVHLHDELRRATSEGGTEAGPRGVKLLPAATEHNVTEAAENTGWRTRRWQIAGAAALTLVLIVAGVRWIESRLNDATARVVAAEQKVISTTELANREVVAAREDADRQIAEARQLAQRAETVGVILTAPDLIRFNLTSAETVGPSAQLLWSRTRGIVLSGSRLPAAPPESTYQLWLVTSTQSVGVGLFVPDDAGRATLVVEPPPRVPGPVVGAAVTIEPTGGRETPSGRTLLARFP